MDVVDKRKDGGRVHLSRTDYEGGKDIESIIVRTNSPVILFFLDEETKTLPLFYTSTSLT